MHRLDPRRRPDLWAAVPGGAVAVLTAGWALAQPDALRGVHSLDGNGYDDGVYLGSSIRLVHGTLAWRDQDFLHPPGITWLMSPVALVGEVVDSQAALVLARVVTVLVAGACCLLAGWVVRDRGPVATLTSSLALACFPSAVGATHTLLLEPYLVLLVLLGLCLAFAGGGIADDRRMLLAGVALGFACTIKVWGVLPALAVLVVLVPRWGAMRRYLLGLGLGGLGPLVPFLLTAPRTFVHDVVVAQLDRETGAAPLALEDRVAMMLGFDARPSVVDPGSAVGSASALVVVLVAVALVRVVRRRATRLDLAVALSVVLVVAAFLQPPQFFDHYAYVLAALVSVALGTAAATVVDEAPLLLARGSRRWVAAPAWATAVTALACVLVVLPGNLDRTRSYLAPATNPGPTIRQAVPVGSCVVTDVPTLLVVAARFPTDRDCTAPLDPFGLWFTDDGGRPAGSPPPYAARFQERWRAWLEQADYVVLSVAYSSFVPWTPELAAWFEASFVQVVDEPRLAIYHRVASRTGSEAGRGDSP